MPPNNPKISLQEGTPPLLTDTHRSLIPPPISPPISLPHPPPIQNHTSSNPTTQGGRRPRQTQDGENGLIAFQLQTWVLVFHITVATPPPGIAHSRFHHPGHPSYTITPHPRKLAVEKFLEGWVAGWGEDVGGRNGGWGRIDREGGRGGRGNGEGGCAASLSFTIISLVVRARFVGWSAWIGLDSFGGGGVV